jgi:hypothetical protein
MNRALVKQAKRSKRIWPGIAAGRHGSSVGSNECIVEKTGCPLHMKNPASSSRTSFAEEPTTPTACARSTYSGKSSISIGSGGRTINDRCDVRGRDTERPLCRLGGLWVMRCAPASCPRRKSYRRC